jgi:hypothetical protein
MYQMFIVLFALITVGRSSRNSVGSSSGIRFQTVLNSECNLDLIVWELLFCWWIHLQEMRFYDILKFTSTYAQGQFCLQSVIININYDPVTYGKDSTRQLATQTADGNVMTALFQHTTGTLTMLRHSNLRMKNKLRGLFVRKRTIPAERPPPVGEY